MEGMLVYANSLFLRYKCQLIESLLWGTEAAHIDDLSFGHLGVLPVLVPIPREKSLLNPS